MPGDSDLRNKLGESDGFVANSKKSRFSEKQPFLWLYFTNSNKKHANKAKKE